MTPARRRRRWLAERAEVGRVEPRPFVVCVANCGSVHLRGERAKRVWLNALTTPGPWGPPDLVLACECADFDAESPTAASEALELLLRSELPKWETVQRGHLGSPQSALALAMRRTRGRVADHHLRAGVPPTSEGGGIRQRPILVGTLLIDPDTPHVWTAPFADGHGHPSRAPRSRGEFMRKFLRVAARIAGGDFNLRQRFLARLTGRRVQAVGVLALMTRRWIRVSRARGVDIGSDHPAVHVCLWP